MTRALLVCPEPLGNGQPAGIGIRFLEIAKVLRADGHTVTLLSRDGGAVDGCRCDAITPDNLRLYSGDSDVAVVQGHTANDFFAHAVPIPTVVDLYDPFIIENLHYHAAEGDQVYRHDHATLMNSLARGDVFLCASEAQRFFYLGLLLAVGRLNPISFANDPELERLVRIAPYGVEAPRPVATRDRSSPAILFGGIYDWYDPILAIEAVVRVRAVRPAATLVFNAHPNPDVTPQSAAARAMRHVHEHHYEDFVTFQPWVAYAGRGAFFDRFTLALLTFPQSIETALSMRTRLYDDLWGGLPIVTSSAPGTDRILTRYDAGIVVRSKNPDDYASAILRLLEGDYDAAVAGARRFVEEHQWPDTLAPLRDFIREPKPDPTRELFAARQEVPVMQPSVVKRVLRRLGGWG